MSENDTGSEPCEFLEWDSCHFGRRIARVRRTQLSADEIRRSLEWCRAARIECLYLLAPSGDTPAIRAIEVHGFQLVDVRVTFQATARTISPSPDAIVRPAQPADREALMQIARSSFHDSRFYCDQNFARSCCDELYATWIERSCNGYADFVLVAENAGQPAGFITGHTGPDGVGSIGLLAVDSAHQGLQLGAHLVNSALCAFRGRGIDTVTVVSQGRNLRAQRLYQKCGFLSRSVDLWYHRWFI
jgi:ribosomal protein S18 acetylase RimI-like enzyme